jgi:DNA-binding NarL/FixJ family response regulator
MVPLQDNIAVKGAPIRLLALCTAILALLRSHRLLRRTSGPVNRFTAWQHWPLARPAPAVENCAEKLAPPVFAHGLPQPSAKKHMIAAASTRLVIADDHPLFRDALRQAVASVVASARIDEAGSFDELTALLEQDSDVDLVLLDLTMPGISGFSGLIYLRAQYPAIPVVIVSASDDVGTIRRSLDFGASGFIPKRFGVETLRDAIMKVMDGDVWVPPDTDLTAAADPDMTRLRDRLVTLTPQQVRVLMMLSEGLLNKQIAYELGVSEATIKAHVSAILQKLGVESRTQAVIAAAKIAGGQWRPSA